MPPLTAAQRGLLRAIAARHPAPYLTSFTHLARSLASHSLITTRPSADPPHLLTHLTPTGLTHPALTPKGAKKK